MKKFLILALSLTLLASCRAVVVKPKPRHHPPKKVIVKPAPKPVPPPKKVVVHPPKKKVIVKPAPKVVIHRPGHVVRVLPAGCKTIRVRNKVYYHNGHNWFIKRGGKYVVVVKP